MECTELVGSWGGERALRPKKGARVFPLTAVLLFSSPSLCFPSNPSSLKKTSRRPPHIMTQLSNPIAVAQTQGSALNPLESDCSSRVKWTCLHCLFPDHHHCYTSCSELLKQEPSRWLTHSVNHVEIICTCHETGGRKEKTAVLIAWQAGGITFFFFGTTDRRSNQQCLEALKV